MMKFIITFAAVIEKSGCSTVGSAPRSGRGGRTFESSHPDKEAIPKIDLR